MIKILLIDDDITLAKLYISILQNNGYHISYAKNSTEAYNYLSYLSFDIILIDYNLTSHNEYGIELIKPIKKILPQSKIAILTNYDDYWLQNKAIKSGANIFAIKMDTASSVLILKLVDTLLKLPTSRQCSC